MTWKQIEGYRYPYRVNDQGAVQKLQENGKWKTLRPWSYRGQMRVHLRRHDGVVERPSVSGLVADYFMGGTPPGMIRVHRNGMKSDNAKENIIFRPRGKSGARPGNCRPVLKIDKNGEVVAVYRSGSEAARANHISQTYMSKLCLGKVQDPYRIDGYQYVYEEKQGRPKKAKA